MGDDIISETNLSDQLEQQTEVNQTHLRPPATPRRRSNPTELEEAGKQMKRAFSTLENCINNRKEEDECDLYAKIFAKKLRKLPENEREIFMYQIDGMFINRLHHCNNQSLTSNTTPSFTSQLSHQPKSAFGKNITRRPSSSFSSNSEPEMRVYNRPFILHFSTSQPSSPVTTILERTATPYKTYSNSSVSDPAQLSTSAPDTNSQYTDIPNQLNATESNTPNLIQTAFYAALDNNYSEDYN